MQNTVGAIMLIGIVLTVPFAVALKAVTASESTRAAVSVDHRGTPYADHQDLFADDE